MKCLYTILALFLLAAICLGDTTSRENPGSVLLFPYYDSTPGNLTLITITNVGELNVTVHLVWVDGETCAPTNIWINLKSHDTLTFLNSALNPSGSRGFLYAHAVSAQEAESEVAYDYLIGNETVIGTFGGAVVSAFSLNAAIFQAIDILPDGDLHLDGAEYGAAPKELYFPRFFGQPELGATESRESRIVLINLTGGKYYEAIADTLIMNDNGKAFSDAATFDCHDLKPLNEFSHATRNAFLLKTAHDPDEPIGFPNLIETGWIRITPVQASNPHSGSIINKSAMYAVLIERMGVWVVDADLPLQTEGEPHEYEKVMLWSVFSGL